MFQALAKTSRHNKVLEMARLREKMPPEARELLAAFKSRRKLGRHSMRSTGIRTWL